MNKVLRWKLTGMILFTLCLIGASHNAFAISISDCDDGFCSVAGNGGTSGADVAKDVFSLGETPYTRLTLPDSAAGFSITVYSSPLGAGSLGTETYSLDLAGDTTNKWYTLTGFDWGNPSVVGDWTVQATYVDGGIVNKFSSFSVTPEPISTTLFLLGGVPIAASLYRKRKRAVKV